MKTFITNKKEEVEQLGLRGIKYIKFEEGSFIFEVEEDVDIDGILNPCPITPKTKSEKKEKKVVSKKKKK